MNSLNGYERFKKSLARSTSPAVNDFLVSRPDTLPMIITGAPSTKIDLTTITTVGIENFSVKLVHGFAVIDASLHCLLDSAQYLEQPPSGTSHLHRMRYVYMHIEQYLNETCLLRGRINDYLKVIPRLYRRDPWYQSLLETTATLTARVNATFDLILNDGDNHLEETRQRDARLDTLMAFGAYPIIKTEAFTSMYTREFQAIHAQWLHHVIEYNQHITDLADLCFGQLHTTLFDTEEALIYPKRLEVCI